MGTYVWKLQDPGRAEAETGLIDLERTLTVGDALMERHGRTWRVTALVDRGDGLAGWATCRPANPEGLRAEVAPDTTRRV